MCAPCDMSLLKLQRITLVSVWLLATWWNDHMIRSFARRYLKATQLAPLPIMPEILVCYQMKKYIKN